MARRDNMSVMNRVCTWRERGDILGRMRTRAQSHRHGVRPVSPRSGSSPPAAAPPSAVSALVGGSPRLLMPHLATLLGIGPALVLQQVRYWLRPERNPHEHDGRRWVYNTYAEWCRQLPFITLRSLRRHVTALEQRGVLLTANYNEDRQNHTKWYTVDSSAMLALEQERRTSAAGAGYPADVHLDTHPLLVLPRLATAIGLNQAIILHQVSYWLATGGQRNIREGHPWVYNTYAQWQANFPFWGESTIEKTIRVLEQRGLLISRQFGLRPGDRTKSYTIDLSRLGHLVPPATPDEAGASRTNGHTGDAGSGGRSSQRRARPGSALGADGAAPVASPRVTPATTSSQPQHQGAAPPDPDPVRSALEAQLTALGIAAAPARTLVRDYAPEDIERHIAMFLWEVAHHRGEPPGPGWLRRRIEENWGPPRGYVGPDERAEDDAAHERAASERAAGIAGQPL